MGLAQVKIIKIKAKNYKAFPSLEIELKKINLIVGKNGSGKSSILRLLPLILDSITQDTIDFTPRGLDLAGRLSDLVFEHSVAKPLSLGIEFEMSGQRYEFLTEIIYHTDYKRIVVLSFQYKDSTRSITLNKVHGGKVEDYLDDKGNECAVFFNGLIPDFNRDLCSTLSQMTSLSSLKNEIKKDFLSYLGPFRKKLNRVFAIKEFITLDIGVEGENTPFILYGNDHRLDSSHLEAINSWMNESMDGASIEIIKDQHSFSIYIRKNKISSNIVDHGVGFSQILPLIANRFNRLLNKQYGVEVVEQPELHIHPSMCGAIIDLYLTALNSDNVIVLETHSKETILRLRRRVAESKLDIFDAVQIIFVDQSVNGSSVDYINVLNDGSVSWWPEGIFEEAYEEIMAIEEINNAG